MAVLRPQPKRHIRVLVEMYENDKLIQVAQYHRIEQDPLDLSAGIILEDIKPYYADQNSPLTFGRPRLEPHRVILDLHIHGSLVPAKNKPDETHRHIEPSLVEGNWRDYLLKDGED